MINHILYHWLKLYHPHILHVTPLEYILKNKKQYIEEQPFTNAGTVQENF